jgi:nucleoside-diphosphate-sugar epimerase
MRKNKTVIITGATGLIGAHLVATAPSGIDYFKPSRTYLTELEELPGADIIIHAAGYGQPSRFMEDPLETIHVNTRVTEHLLESLKPGGSFLFCSSTEIYSGLTHPAREEETGTTTPQHPRSCYIEGKRCGEAIVQAYRNKGVQAASARIGHTYGPGVRKGDTRVMSQLIDQALTKGSIDLLDSGCAIRTFCYATDTARMLWDIALKGTQGVYNVGGKSVISIWGLAQMIADKTGCQFSSRVANVTELMDIGAPQEVLIDLTRIEEEFGKRNYVTLDEGLDDTIAWQGSL